MDTIYIWAFGFVLGLKHALDADHLVAVSAIATRYKSPWKSAFAGAVWGAGHTATLLLVGLVLLVFRWSIPPALEQWAELAVGLVLMWLGVSVIRRSVAMKLHVHGHNHGERFHLHFHTHQDSEEHSHSHGRSLLVGMTHGLAGSAALMLLVLSGVKSVFAGIVYILIFGIGTILGMLVFGGVIGIPLRLSANSPKLSAGFRLTAGFASLGLGLLIVAENWPKA
jgi:sulfite exporter TauE/SafE